MELVILFLLIALAVAAGIIIAAHFGIVLLGVLVFFGILVVGTVAWLAIGVVVGVPLSIFEARFARIPAPTRHRMELYARWALRGIAAALVLWIIGAVVCYRATT